MPLAETITEFVNFILKGVVDLIDHTSIFLLRAINQFYVVIDGTKEFLLGRNINISAQAETYEFSVRCTETNLIFK